jgi:mono/diheme cytochrome c family protein
MTYRLTFATALLAVAPAFAAHAYDPQAALQATQTECSACHMAYPPNLLPARSWTKIMGTLDNHFGENAQLDDATRAEIETFLVNNAADSGGRAMRGVPASQTPLRITELPWFKGVHSHEVSNRMRQRAGSMSNCLGCHSGGGAEGGEREGGGEY